MVLSSSPCHAPPAVQTSRVAAFPLFADLPAAELDALAAVMRVVRAHAGMRVVTRDDYGTAVYVIEEGEAEVLTDGGEPVKLLRPGDMFGEIALLLTGQRTATIVARTPMRLLTLSGHEFDRIRARVPELERSLRGLGVERVGW
jgi:CRP-like cAMP-binding protein